MIGRLFLFSLEHYRSFTMSKIREDACRHGVQCRGCQKWHCADDEILPPFCTNCNGEEDAICGPCLGVMFPNDYEYICKDCWYPGFRRPLGERVNRTQNCWSCGKRCKRIRRLLKCGKMICFECGKQREKNPATRFVNDDVYSVYKILQRLNFFFPNIDIIISTYLHE